MVPSSNRCRRRLGIQAIARHRGVGSRTVQRIKAALVGRLISLPDREYVCRHGAAR
jgi:hypothetical protein